MSLSKHIIIVGSALTGASMAAALAENCEITLLDRAVHNAPITDERPISLSYSTVIFLKNLGLWDDFISCASPIKTVHISEQGRLGRLELKASDLDLPALGYVVPYYQLHQRLYDYVMSRDNVTQILIDDVTDIKNENEKVIVSFLKNMQQQMLTADYFIAADGVNSHCRELLHIPHHESDHHDVALAAMVTTSMPHQAIAYERFTKQGVLAMLPMWQPNQFRLVWTLNKSAIASLSDVELKQRIEATFASRVGMIESVTRIGTYPLKTMSAKRQVVNRCVLLGDSAHRIYPLAAQGYNLTVRDVALLADLIEKEASLSDYVKQRQHDQRFITQFTQSLEWVFGLDIPLLDHLRGSTLLAMDLMPTFKRQIIKKLLGRGVPQPPLLCEL